MAHGVRQVTPRQTAQHPIAFSVVIPTYERAAFVVSAVQSVLAQTLAAHEIIVLDDASTDDTAAVLQRYVDAGQIVLARHNSNRERGAARNSGADLATGDYLVFLDSDDVMEPGCLADAALAARAHEMPGLLHCRHRLVDAAGNVVSVSDAPQLGNDPLRALANGNFLSCSGVFARRDVFATYRFDEALEMVDSEDWELWLRVLTRHDLARIDRIGVTVMHHDGRSVRSPDLARLSAGYDLMFAKYDADPELRAKFRPYRRRMIASSWLYRGVQANVAGRHWLAARQVARALLADPSVAFTDRPYRVFRRAILRRR